MRRLRCIFTAVLLSAAMCVPTFAQKSIDVGGLIEIGDVVDEEGNDVDIIIEQIGDDKKDIVDELLDKDTLKDVLKEEFDDDTTVIDVIEITSDIDKPVKIELQIPGLTEDDIPVILQHDGNSWVRVPVLIEDGKIYIIVDKPGPIAVLKKPGKSKGDREDGSIDDETKEDTTTVDDETQETTEGGGSHDTGDHTNVTPLVVALNVSMVILLIAGIVGRRNNKEEF